MDHELKKAFIAYSVRQEQLRAFEADSLEKASETMEIAELSYYEGEMSLTDLLDAARSYRDMQNSYVEAVINYQLSILEIEKAVGRRDNEIIL